MASEKEAADNRAAADGKPSYRRPVAVITLVGLTLGAILTAFNLWDRIFPPSGPPDVSAEYIVDVSKGMAGRIGKKVKLAAVKREVVDGRGATPDLAAALRLTGGECTREYRKPHVDFGEENADEFEEAFSRVRAGGESDYTQALAHTVNDFISRDKEAKGRVTTVFVFVGGRDTCTPRPVEKVKRSLRYLRAKSNVDVSFKFVGVKVPGDVARSLRAARRAAKALGFQSRVAIADTEAELDDVAEEAIEAPDDSPMNSPGP